MKTRNLLLTLSAAALTAVAFNTSAELFSPRAAGNQITTVATTANDPDLVAVDQGLATSPRASANAITTVAGTAKEINPATKCSRNITASPKSIQACAANNAGAMPCCAGNVAASK